MNYKREEAFHQFSKDLSSRKDLRLTLLTASFSPSYLNPRHWVLRMTNFNRRLLLSAGVAAMVGSALAGYLAYPVRHPVASDHFDIRSKAIISQANQKKFSQLFLGDSVVELALIDRLCGLDTLNAGVGSMTVSDLAALARRLPYVPSNILVSVGLNDAARSRSTRPDTFASIIEQMVLDLKRRGAERVSIGLIQPVSDTKPLGKVIFDTDLIAKYNGKIEQVSEKTGSNIIHFDRLPITASGGLVDDLTIDGVHLSDKGYPFWYKQVQESCLTL